MTPRYPNYCLARSSSITTAG
ncbi:hypothetical protein YPPY06_1101, partial [Yersinia pestis PY-06]